MHNDVQDSSRRNNLHRLFNVAEAAKFLGLSAKEVRYLELSGLLKAAVPFNVNAKRRKVRFTAGALREYARWNGQLDLHLERLCEEDGGKRGGIAGRLLTVAETAEFLGLSTAEVRGYERSGFLTAAVPRSRGTRRRRIMFTTDALREFIRMNHVFDDLTDFFESGP